MSTIARYLAANARYAEGFDKGDLPTPPAHAIAVVACMDARIETGAMLGLLEGDAHVIRNAGGIVTEDVIRSLMISQHLLGTREVMLIQHTACGMLGLENHSVADQVERRTGHRPPFALGGFTDLEKGLSSFVEELKASPYLIHTDAIRGFVFEVETGRLREVK